MQPVDVRVRRFNWRALLQVAVSAALLYAAWQAVGGKNVANQFTAFHWKWALLGGLLTVPQVMISALRWRLTAERLGALLGYPRAVADYFLATFVNQVLPTGVLGDALRAWRHGRRLPAEDSAGMGTAVRAVVYERASGQAVMLALVLLGAALWPLLLPAAESLGWRLWTGLAVLCTVAALTLLALSRLYPGLFDRARRMGKELAYAVFHHDVVLRQGVLSILVVASYVMVFYCAARTIGIVLSWEIALLMVPAVLLSMAIPVSVAGWGIRESVAALLWAAAGYSAAQGVAISVAYGVLVLAASLPGAAVLASGR